MRFTRICSAIGITLIGLTFLLATPDIGSSQEADQAGSVDRPLGHALSSISWFSWNGIWVRTNGSWAWRPTVRHDWQAYFKCRDGYGCGGVGRASHSFWSWLPGGYGSWDLVPGGWMWFPGDRFSKAWDLWFLGPRREFGAHGFGPQFRPSFAVTGWDGGLTMVRTDQRFMPAHRFERQNQAVVTSIPDGRDRNMIRVDPVRNAPVVTLRSDGKGSGPSGRVAPQKPSIDRVRRGPVVEIRADRARQDLMGKPSAAFERALESGRARSAPGLNGFTPLGLQRPTSPLVNWRRSPMWLSPRNSAPGRLGQTGPAAVGSKPTGTKPTGRSELPGKKAPAH